MGEEVFSVYEIDFDEVIGGDIVYVNELSRKNGFTDKSQLIIQKTDRSELFYFNLTDIIKDKEYPVYLTLANNRSKYADNFLDFLAKRIRDST